MHNQRATLSLTLTPSCDRLPEVHTGSRAMEVNQKGPLAQVRS